MKDGRFNKIDKFLLENATGKAVLFSNGGVYVIREIATGKKLFETRNELQAYARLEAADLELELAENRQVARRIARERRSWHEED